MLRKILRSEIQNATVTDKQLYYKGSIGIDKALLLESDILANEKVQVTNLNNGACFETYVIEEQLNSGVITLYGPTARQAEIGDKISIISYGLTTSSNARALKPKIILLDNKNESTR